MHAGSLRALEFDRVIEAVRGLAVTPRGTAHLEKLRPMTDLRGVQAALAATTEGVRYLEHNGTFPLDAPADFDATIAILAIEGRAVEPMGLVKLARFLASIDQVRTAVTQASGGPFPLIKSTIDGCASFEREVADIRSKIDESGAVVDDATTELRSIRERLRKQRARLRNTLESYLRGKETAKYLQDQIVTEREGRYVLIVKAEHRSAIPGIVHGSSTSGASLFLEPLSTVEINNDIVTLAEEETAEVQRILLALSNALRKRAYELHRTLTAATDLDVIQAKAAFSGLTDGSEPELVTEACLELSRARHPLLIRAVAGRLSSALSPAAGLRSPSSPQKHPAGGRQSDPLPPGTGERERVRGEPAAGPVPIDLRILPPSTALIITGPNTGGKTVALKTAGLLALMAQAGLHVPAAPGSRLPVFRSVFADIGDDQSIAANLSTFSGHITNIVSMDEQLALPALVLLDEVGAGTDPIEGGALGRAIVEHFRQRGAIVVATTHDEMLKSYASTSPGVAVAGFGFDPETYAPTFELKYGTPGRSLAFEIATRLGLAPSITVAARGHRGARETQLADHLAQVDRDLRAIDEQRERVASDRTRLDEVEATLRSREDRVREREEAVRQRLQTGLNQQLRAAREQIETVMAALRERVEALIREANERVASTGSGPSTGELGALKSETRDAVEALVQQFEQDLGASRQPSLPASAEMGAPDAPVKLTIGDRVHVRGLGLEGTIRAVQAREVEVEASGKRLRVPVDDVTFVARSASAVAGGRVSVHLDTEALATTDLNVIGCTVDEALTRTEKFLDQAVLNELHTVRVIHGHGTGQLRRAIADYLGGHPFVARFQAAPPDQGGGGVTVVELKD